MGGFLGECGCFLGGGGVGVLGRLWLFFCQWVCGECLWVVGVKYDFTAQATGQCWN